MEHNFFIDLIGCLTLPLFIFLAFGMMAGVKPDIIFGGFFRFAAALLQPLLICVFQLLFFILRETFKLLVRVASNGAGRLTAQQQARWKSRVKIIVED